jgi:diguanylate cyclase (GGDEF)-like protein
MAYHWSIHQLTEYLDSVTSQLGEPEAIRVALERAIEALGGELGALVRDGSVLACVGLGRETPPVDALLRATEGAAIITLPSLGALHASTARLDGDLGGHLVVGRVDAAFTPEERQLMQGMASVLGLSLRGIRTLQDERALRTEREQVASERLRLLDSLGQRQRLLESVLSIQRAISHREPLQTVLDSVTRGAAEVSNGAYVALVLTEPVEGRHRIVSSVTPADDERDHGALVMAAAAAAVTADGVVARAIASELDSNWVVLAAPVHIEGTTAGSLVTVSIGNDADVVDRQAMLDAFAEQASLALTDARTLDAMRDAYQDSLTGLPNRALFLDRLNHALAVATRQDEDVTVLFIDLDRFKDVNDSLGHAAGDELLAWFAKQVSESLRSDDTAARIGGDEFAVLLERTTGFAAGQVVAERLTEALLEPVHLAGREVFAFASIGIACSDEVTRSAEDLLRNADIAMYRAKRNGGRAALRYEPSMHTETIDGLELSSDLYRVVLRGELRLQYQPLIDLATGQPVAVEALVRWDHPVRGLIPPNVFIPIAERNGCIADIGEWVLRRSCAQAAIWRASTLPDLRISVNVSARQLDDVSFADLVASVLRETGLPPEALTIEVTESVLMRDPERAIEYLGPLKALGVRLAIDDFGTGYSSLAALQHFPADQLKIDKAFIDTVETSIEGLAIVRTVVELARTLQMETVAEGIETAQQNRSLAALRCDLGQGYLYSRPLATESVADYFAISSKTATAAS